MSKSAENRLAWQERELKALKASQVVNGSAVPVVVTTSQTFTFTLNEVTSTFDWGKWYYGEFNIYFTPTIRGRQLTTINLYSTSTVWAGYPEDHRWWQLPQDNNGRTGIHILLEKVVPNDNPDRTVTVKVQAISTSGGTFTIS